MPDSALKRFWNAIKPPPAPVRHEWDQVPPSAWKRFWRSIKPPPAVSLSGALLDPEVVRRRRRIVIASVTLVAGALVGVEIYRYVSSAPQRSEAALAEGARFAAAGNGKLAIDRLT